MSKFLDPVPPDFRLERFSSDTYSASLRLDAWRDVLARKLFRTAVDPLKQEPYRARVMMRAQHDVRIGTGTIGPSVNRRTQKIVAGDNDDFTMLVNLDGTLIVTQRDREISLRMGDAFLLTCTEKGTYVCPSATRILCLRIPHASLSRYVPAADRATGRPIPRETSALRLLKHYAATLFEDDDIAMAPGASRMVVDHIVDLAVLGVGTSRDMAAFIAARSAGNVQLRIIKSDIERNLSWRDLTVTWLAMRHGVSTRHIYRLFERDGTSFSEYLLCQRLANARRMLTSARYSAHGVGAIAYQCGFGDISYFNRVFRRRFGMTPSDARRAKAN